MLNGEESWPQWLFSSNSPKVSNSSTVSFPSCYEKIIFMFKEIIELKSVCSIRKLHLKILYPKKRTAKKLNTNHPIFSTYCLNPFPQPPVYVTTHLIILCLQNSYNLCLHSQFPRIIYLIFANTFVRWPRWRCLVPFYRNLKWNTFPWL